MTRREAWWRIPLKGFVMGAADVVPGVSGGTMALVLGIYPRFIAALGSLSPKLLMPPRLLDKWKRADLPFLALLGLGIGCAIVSLAKVIPALIRAYPESMNGLFLGMIVASIAIPLRMVRVWDAGPVSAAAVGAAVGWLVTTLTSVAAPDSLQFLFVAGTIAISAMLLPGVSGSFLLLIMGQYARVLDAIHERDLVVIGVFGAGCALGLLGFSRVLSALLRRAPDLTLATLTGLMLGSCRKLWPFEVPLDSPVVIAGKTVMDGVKVWPWSAAYDGPVLVPLLLMVVGAALVLVLDALGNRQSSIASPSSS